MKANRAVSSFLAVVFGVVLTSCPIGFGKTIRVANDGSADYTTIQAAIDASVDGDVILVAPGTYTGDGNRDIDFAGKAITVQSENGPADCIIDCRAYPNEPHRGGHFHQGETPSSVLQGFTIKNGRPAGHERGGAVFCENSAPMILDCILTKNRARMGGALAADNSAVRVVRCVVSDNVAHEHGGGIWCSGSRDFTAVVSFEGCLVVGNYAVANIRFGGDGGGMLIAGVNCEISNCTIAGNRAGYAGGGIAFWYANGIVSNSILCENSFGLGHGAEIAVTSSKYDVRFGGTRQWVTIEHSMIGSGDAADFSLASDEGGALTGRWLVGDPCFVRPGYWDPNGTPEEPLFEISDDFWVDGDYHLKSQAGRWDPNAGSWVQDDVTSPCIDAGDPNDPIGDEPFPNGGRINMGAYGGTGEASLSPTVGPTAGLWSDPVPLREVNLDSAEEWSPTLSADGLTLYFGRVRGPQSEFGRILQATREAPVPWCRFTGVADVSGDLNRGTEHVLCPWISWDGLRMYYTCQVGSIFRLMVSERPAGSAQWPTGREIYELNLSDSRLHTCRLTADELTIFFTGPDVQNDRGEYDLWMATRADHDARFTEPVNLASLNSSANDQHPAPSPDGLSLYFVSNRNGCYQLFKSTRSDWAGSFGPPVHMTLFDTLDGHSQFPCLAPDGTEFYFVREAAEGRSTRDIWVSYRLD